MEILYMYKNLTMYNNNNIKYEAYWLWALQTTARDFLKNDTAFLHFSEWYLNKIFSILFVSLRKKL